MHSGGSARTAEAGSAGSPGATAAAAAVASAIAKDGDEASDKENVAEGEQACGTKAGSQAQTAAACPTGSQQLMPPPGGLQVCGTRPAADQPAQHPAQQQLERQPQHLAPTQPVQAPAGSRQQQQHRGVGAGGGFGFEDDAEDELMAQLELELLTQVEQRQAARRAAGTPRGPALQPAPTQPAPAVAAGPTAAPLRPQAAPPAAQHPAAAAQQQTTPAPAAAQQRQQAQPRPLPRSPYDRQALLPAPAAAAAATPAAPEAPAAARSAPAATGQGADSGWGDDEEDLALLDQFEAAALRERASGGQQQPGQQAALQGQQAPAAAEGGGGPPAGAASARQPCYPGNRQEVHYTIKEVFPGGHEQVLLLHNKYQVGGAGGEGDQGSARDWGAGAAGVKWGGGVSLTGRDWGAGQLLCAIARRHALRHA